MRAMARLRDLLERGGAGPRRATLVSWVVSLAVHTVVIVGAFFVVWTVSTVPAEIGPAAVVSFRDPAPAAARSEDREAQDDAREAGEALDVEISAPELEMPSLDSMFEQSEESAQRVSDVMLRGSVSDLMYERRYPEVEFFGQGASDAKSIVYVVDGSGSTVSTFPLLKRELAASLGGLSPTQVFQVVFFRGDSSRGEAGYLAAPDPRAPDRSTEVRLIRATRANVAAVLSWMEGVEPSGRSNPIPALGVALGLEPEAVFLLSGEITGAGVFEIEGEAVLRELEVLNPADGRTGNRRVTIKVIGFLREDASGLLRDIGLLHGGADGYTFIGLEGLRR